MTAQESSDEPAKVLVVGGGGIGCAMALVFADAGFEVVMVEPDEARRGALRDELKRRHAPMRRAGLARSTVADAVSHVRLAVKAGDEVAGAGLIVEAGPERLDVKRSLFADLLAGMDPEAVLITTSSAMTISEIVEQPEQRARCLVAHPANPPTLVRVIECVPAPQTDPAAARAAADTLAVAGFVPVILGAELPGFAFNRLQSAVLRESYRLVGEGVIDVAGLDALVRDGLGLRWALSGPFETSELNTPGGIAGHAARMGPAYRAIGESRGERDCEWSAELVAEVEAQRRALVPADRLAERAAWREDALADLIAVRRAILDRGEHDDG